MDIFLKECYLKKTNQYDALRVPNMKDELRVTSLLKLSLEADGGETKKNVVATKDVDGENGQATRYKIGVLSDDDAKDIRKFMEAGWTEDSLFECRVCKYDEKADENKRISVAIYIRHHGAPANQDEGINAERQEGVNQNEE